MTERMSDHIKFLLHFWGASQDQSIWRRARNEQNCSGHDSKRLWSSLVHILSYKFPCTCYSKDWTPNLRARSQSQTKRLLRASQKCQRCSSSTFGAGLFGGGGGGTTTCFARGACPATTFMSLVIAVCFVQEEGGTTWGARRGILRGGLLCRMDSGCIQNGMPGYACHHASRHLPLYCLVCASCFNFFLDFRARCA